MRARELLLLMSACTLPPLLCAGGDKGDRKKGEEPKPEEKSEEEKPPPRRTVEGFVVDAKNVLQPGAELAFSWTFTGGAIAPDEPAIKADAKGRFSHVFDPWPDGVTLIGFDARREKCAIVAIGEEESKKPVTVRLGPAARVKGKLASAEAAVKAEGVRVEITHVDTGVTFGCAAADAKGLAFRAPPGKYRLSTWHADFRALEQEFEVPAKYEHDLGALKLTPTPLACGIGREMPPLKVKAVRGAKPDVQLSDYRGKWVLLEFWGSW
jgi:hypothetical protein